MVIGSLYLLLFKTVLAQDDNVLALISNIVPNQDNNEILPQALPIEQTKQPQELPFWRSTRERRNAILNHYIVFLQEHEDGVGLIEDDLINLHQAMHSSNS